MNNLSKYQQQSLSILIHQDGFSFLVIHEQKVIEFESHFLQQKLSPSQILKYLKKYINSDFQNKNEIENLDLIYVNPLFSIVPNELFDENYLPHYLKYNAKLLEGDDFEFDDIQPINAKNVYIPYVNIHNYLFEIFGSFSYKHHLSICLSKFSEDAAETGEFVILNDRHNALDFMAFRDGKLIVANTFIYDTAEDFVYYTLFTLEELNFNRETLQLEVLGEMNFNKDDEKYVILKNYIQNIKESQHNTITSDEFSSKKAYLQHINLI